MPGTKTCAACTTVNPSDHAFCGHCGEELDAPTLAPEVRRAIDAYLDRSLEERDVVEYRIAEAADERVMSWAKLIAFFAGALVAGLIAVLSWFSSDLRTRKPAASRSTRSAPAPRSGNSRRGTRDPQNRARIATAVSTLHPHSK